MNAILCLYVCTQFSLGNVEYKYCNVYNTFLNDNYPIVRYYFNNIITVTVINIFMAHRKYYYKCAIISTVDLGTVNMNLLLCFFLESLMHSKYKIDYIFGTSSMRCLLFNVRPLSISEIPL